MVPGVFTSDSPCRAARPERGWTSATYPSGRAIAMPVGTTARSPGDRVTSTVVTRSAPASPGWAYDGSGRSGASRTTATGRPGSDTTGTLMPDGPGRGRGWLAVLVSTEPTPGLSGPAEHHERLSVPLRWWVQGTMLVATFWLAFVVSTPALVAGSATAVLVLAMAALLLGYGAVRVDVADGSLRAGRATIPGEYLAGAESLDPDATRRVA